MKIHLKNSDIEGLTMEKSPQIRHDLFLKADRLGKIDWVQLDAPARYKQGLVMVPYSRGRIFLQGSILDDDGREMNPTQIAAMIERYGKQALNKFDGSFAIAVTEQDHGVWCATDHSASYPLYYKLTAESLLITTRAEQMKDFGSSIDLNTVLSTLNAGYPWRSQTLFKEWRALPPGSTISITRDNVSTIETYFSPEDDGSDGYNSPDELIEDLDEVLIGVGSRFKKILVPLSGGVDSRLIAARCHKLGIPFESITFVANVYKGDDYDIAVQLAKQMNLKHHRWDWKPDIDCCEKFIQFCKVTGGTNDAYTSYPDAMTFFNKIASEFDCVLRGDHVVGYGPYSDSLYDNAYTLNINFKDSLQRTLKDPQQPVNLADVFQREENIDLNTRGRDANQWKQHSYRMSRSPRFLLPLAQYQAQATNVVNPLLAKKIVSKTAASAHSWRDNKRILREAMTLGSTPAINGIPLATEPTWVNGEPLMNLPHDVIEQMKEFMRKPSELSELINEAAIIDAFSLSKREQEEARKSLKDIIKPLVPANIRKMLRRQVYPKVDSRMIFKRLFAIKSYLSN